MADREVVRIVTMRSTIHTHTADDCLTLRPLVQPARDRELTNFRKGLVGVDLDRLAVLARDLVEAEPRTMGQLREALARAVAGRRPAVPRRRRPLPAAPASRSLRAGLWGRSGQVALTTAEHWLGRPAEPAPPCDAVVLRYLAAFGPASVKDMQTWAGLTRLREAFERLRPQLSTFRDEHGVELFDLPDAPAPTPDTPAPPRFLPEFDNLLLSHADRGPRRPARVLGALLAGQPGVLHAPRRRLPGGSVETGAGHPGRRAVRSPHRRAETGRARRGRAHAGRDAPRGGLRHPFRNGPPTLTRATPATPASRATAVEAGNAGNAGTPATPATAATPAPRAARKRKKEAADAETAATAETAGKPQPRNGRNPNGETARTPPPVTGGAWTVWTGALRAARGGSQRPLVVP